MSTLYRFDIKSYVFSSVTLRCVFVKTCSRKSNFDVDRRFINFSSTLAAGLDTINQIPEEEA